MKKTLSIIAIALLLSGAGIFGYNKAIANPSRLAIPVTCSTQGTSATVVLATTSLSYITAGTATTTATCNTQLGGLGVDVLDSASLQLFYSASSTAASLRINIEYSNDGVDWYQDGGSFVSDFATTTKPFDISTVNQFNLQFASSSAGLGSPITNSSTTTRMISIKAPTKWIRAVFSVPAGSQQAAIWAGFVNKAEKVY